MLFRSGGLFAPYLLRDLGLGEVVTPRHPGVFAALGLQFADLRHQVQASFALALESFDGPDLQMTIERLRQRLDIALDGDGVPENERRFSFLADMRYVGQHHELEVELPPHTQAEGAWRQAIESRFHALHERRYGYAHAASPVEFTSLHGVGVGRLSKPAIQSLPSIDTEPQAREHRRVPLGRNDEWVEAPVYHRTELGVGQRLSGPALIVQDDSTSLVLAGQSARVDDIGFLRITED